MNLFRILLVSLLIVFFFLSINHATTSKKGGEEFSFENEIHFDWSVSQQKISAGFGNLAHIKGFFVMTLLSLLAFGRRKYTYTLGFVLVLSLLTESLQMWTPTRHGRLIDFIPNITGMVLAILLFRTINMLKSIVVRRAQVVKSAK